MYGSTAHKDALPLPEGRPGSGPGTGPGAGLAGPSSRHLAHQAHHQAHHQARHQAHQAGPATPLRVDRHVLDQQDLQRRYCYQGDAVIQPDSEPGNMGAAKEKEGASSGASSSSDGGSWWGSCCRSPGCSTSCSPGCSTSCSPGCSPRSFQPMQALRSVFPIVDWLGQYQPKDLVGDLVAGFTVAVLHIPQGLAYALLGSVPPVVGIYMAFFPVLVYCLFGTSRHVSMGTFAVVCLMTGRVVLGHSQPSNIMAANLTAPGLAADDVPLPTPIEVASAVAAVCGLIQLAMCALRLGVLSALLSESLVSGFTSAAAVHVLTSQLKDLLGVPLAHQPRGTFKIVLTWVEVCSNLGSANMAAVLVSLCCMMLITLNNELLKPWLARRCPIPVPIELIVVVTGTLLASGPTAPLMPYGLTPLGSIPTGFPAPKPPSASLMLAVAAEAVPIAVVAYTIAMSMALIFATKNGYSVRPNQELLALGASNVAGSLFSCMPITASLSRSAVQEQAGGRTQLTSLVSCSLLTFVLLWAAPFFEPLPRCVLAAIIVVALRSMLLGICEGPRFVRQSRWDGAVWLGTFLAVVVVDIDVGLGVGTALSLLALVCQAAVPQAGLLAPLPAGADGLYGDPGVYGTAQPLPGITIVRFGGVLNFATRAAFMERLHELVGVHPDKELARRKKAQTRHQRAARTTGSTDNFVEEMKREEELQEHAERGDAAGPGDELLVVVVDVSGLVRVDPEGVRALQGAADKFSQLGVGLWLAAPGEAVLQTLVRVGARLPAYPSLHDAVTAARAACEHARPNTVNSVGSSWTLAAHVVGNHAVLPADGPR